MIILNYNSKRIFYKPIKEGENHMVFWKKLDHKTSPYHKDIWQLREEVDALGTAITKLLNLKIRE